MGKAIPAKIKKYPGLVQAWKARYGKGNIGFYDPPRKKRSTRHGSTSRKKPKRKTMSRAYGKVKGKPYRVGSREGVAWSGATRLRYDPNRRRRRSNPKGFLDKALNKFEGWTGKYGDVVGFLVGFLAPLITIYHRFSKGTGFYQYPGDNSIMAFFTKGIPMEISQLLSQPLPGNPAYPDQALNTLQYLEWKFTNEQSGWRAPFWASLATYLGCKFGIFGMILSLFTNKANRIIKPIQKVAGGALVATTVGALVIPGTRLANEQTSSGNPAYNSNSRSTPSPSRSPSSMYG